jgi:hypothetical protein
MALPNLLMPLSCKKERVSPIKTKVKVLENKVESAVKILIYKVLNSKYNVLYCSNVLLFSKL